MSVSSLDHRVCEYDFTQLFILICIRRSGSAGRRRTRDSDTERDGEIDAQGVFAVRTVPAADQADHRAPGSKFQGEPPALGAVVAHVFGYPAAATQRPQIFDCPPAEVRRRLRDRGREVRPVRRKSECAEVGRCNSGLVGPGVVPV